MLARRRIAAALLASVTAASPGCAGSAPFGWFGSNSAANAPPFSIEQTATPESYVQRMQQPAPPEPGAARTADALPNPYRQAASGGMTASVSNAISKVGDALAIQPKVVPADDPVRLSSMPQHVGAEVYVSTARAYEQQGNLDAARQQYERALEIAPHDVAVLVAYARLFDREGAPQQALQIYQRAVQTNPNSALALNDLALCRARQGDLEGSLQALERAVALEPTRQMYRNNIATVLAEAGRFDQAFQQLAAVHPPAVAHYNMGYLLQQRQRLDDARLHYTKCLEIDPSLAAAQRQLAQIAAAQPAGLRQAASPQLNAAGPAPEIAPSTMRASSYSPAPSADQTPAMQEGGAFLPRNELESSARIETPPQDWGQAPLPESYGGDPSAYEAPRLLPPVR